jgi:AcrR family transcriptional regulator
VDTDRQLTPQGVERKQQLLDRAAELFAERGYAETRVIDIVRAAGVAKGLFYWYFENKEALFTELAASIRFRLRKHQAQVIDPVAPPLARLRQGTEGSVEFMAEHAHFFSLLEVEGRNFTDVLRRGTEQHLADTEELVRAGQADGSVRDEDPRLLALGVVGAVGHYSHFHRTGRITMPLDELAAFVGRFVVHSLAADDEAARTALRLPARALQTR